MNNNLISVKDAAKLMEVSPRTVYRYLYNRENKIPYQVIAGRLILRRSDIEKFIKDERKNRKVKAVRTAEKKG